MVCLIAVPYLALPVYLFLGHSRFPGYVSARRSSRKVIRDIKDFGRTHPARVAADAKARDYGAVAFEQLADMPVLPGNSASLLIDGDATFEAIFEAIDAAQSYVLVMFYIIRDDGLGRDLKDRLIARAQAGCTVRLLYDTLGSHGLSEHYIRELRDARVVVTDFHSIRQPRSRLQLNFRNHRKIVVVDGRTAFIGGHNVGDEYMGRDANFGHWRDTHIRLEGPVVAQIQLVFAEDWYWATDERLDLFWEPPSRPENLDALIVAPGPADPMETGSLYFCNAIGAARRRIWITSPYFVPDIDILTSLKLAALRGVDVRILVADKRDHWLVWLAAFTYFDEVRDAGVKIFRYRDGFMHQKVILVDDDLAAIGTVNLDNRSCRLNFEITALIFDAGFAHTVERMIEADFAKSYAYDTPLNQSPSLLRRVGAPVARLFAPVL